jgi:hypothetical protein
MKKQNQKLAVLLAAKDAEWKEMQVYNGNFY